MINQCLARSDALQRPHLKDNDHSVGVWGIAVWWGITR
jgi:hypothetical protein